MKILAIDTATEACSAALWLDGQLLSRFERAGRSHTELLLPMVQRLMSEADCSFARLDGIACGVGPGSFAGVRIAVGFVKGLALALDRPVVGVSSLAMLAQAETERGAAQVIAAIDARMNEVYLGAYGRGADGRAVLMSQEVVCAPQSAAPLAGGDWVAVGTGWGTYQELLAAALGVHPVTVDGKALPAAQAALKLAVPEFEAGRSIGADALAPSYLRNKVALTLEEQARLRAANQA